MLVKLPLSTMFHIGPRDARGEVGRLAMPVAYGTIDKQPFGMISLTELEPGEWAVTMTPDDLDLCPGGEREQFAMGECVTVEGVENLVGFVLPESVEGRRLPRHAVVQEPDGSVQAYEDLDAIRAKHGKLVVGHEWQGGERKGYLRCSRCREELKCEHPLAQRRTVPVVAGTAESCTACGAEIGRWVA